MYTGGGTIGVANGGAESAAAGNGSNIGGDVTAGASGMMATVMDPVPVAAADQPTDGTRLRAIYLIGADGSRQPQLNWWDSERLEECSFVSFLDGTNRCVPTASGQVSGLFSDSTCSADLFQSVTSQCATVKYALTPARPNCEGSYESINALTPIIPTAAFAMSGTPPKCTDSSFLLTTYAGTTFYTGAPVPLTSFVSATKQHG
jgi:hypothetical protein